MAASNSTADYYSILGVERDATTDEIKRGFKKRAREWHPDRHTDKPEEEKLRAAEKFKEIAQAAEVLLDEKKRELYDTYGAAATDADTSGFEDMFMRPEPTNQKGTVGGPLFMDARGQFFQRGYLDIEALRREAKQGLPVAEAALDEKQTHYNVSTTVPAGPWELKVIEADEAKKTVTLTFVAGEWETEPGWNAVKNELRLARTFHLPADADVMAVDDAVVQITGDGSLRLAAPKRHAVSSATGAATAASESAEETLPEPDVADLIEDLLADEASKRAAFVVGAAPEEVPPHATKGKRHGKSKRRGASPVSVVAAECKENGAYGINVGREA